MATAKKNGAVAKATSASKTKNKVGRPTNYTEALGNKICEKISNGQSLLKICKAKTMPARSTVHKWLLALNEDGTKKHQEFVDNYALAMELRADYAFDEIIDIADETPSVIRKSAEKKSGAMANAQRLRVDTRKWAAARMFPKKYSDRKVLTTEDEDGKTMPITGNVIEFESQN